MIKVLMLVVYSGSSMGTIAAIDGFTSLKSCQREAERLEEEAPFSLLKYRCVEVK